MNLSYVNKKGKQVVVSATEHAIKRFKERWTRFYGAQPYNFEEVFTKNFNSAKPPKLGKKYKERKKNYSMDTIFLKSTPFVFVVQDKTIVTVELSQNRELN